MKNKIFWCAISFGLGVFVCGWCLLILSQRASEIWVVESTTKMAFQFEQRSKSEFAKNNKMLARDFINSALLIRQALAVKDSHMAWPIDMPMVGLSAPFIGMPEFTALTNETISSKKILISDECAMVALTGPETQEIYLHEMQKEFPQIDLETCKSIGIAFLNSTLSD